MRLGIFLFSASALVATGWKVGAWCGDALTDNLQAWCEKQAAKREMKQKTKLDSVK